MVIEFILYFRYTSLYEGKMIVGKFEIKKL